MFDRARMQQMIGDILRELDVDYRPASLFEPRDRRATWCVDFIDEAAPQFERTFQVCVEWGEGSTEESVRAELKAKLAARIGA